MVPVNEVTPEGQPRLWIRDLPPISSSGAPEIDAAADLLRRERQPLRRRARPAAGVRLSRATRARARATTTTSWTGQTRHPARLDPDPAAVRAPVPRPRPADLNQVTADSQLLFHRTIAERLATVAPFLRYDKDPYLVVDERPPRLRPGRVHDQRPVPERDLVRHVASWATTSGLGGDDVQLHPEQREDHDGRLRRDDALLRRRPDGPAHPRLAGDLPRAVRAAGPDAGGELQAHLRVPEELFNVQTRVYGQYHVNEPLTFFNNTDRWTVPDRSRRTSRASSPRPTTS